MHFSFMLELGTFTFLVKLSVKVHQLSLSNNQSTNLRAGKPHDLYCTVFTDFYNYLFQSSRFTNMKIKKIIRLQFTHCTSNRQQVAGGPLT